MNKDEFDKRYNLIISKKRSSSISWFYGVSTTGVFCIPGCSSRLPREENTFFFDSAHDALHAGFRPCKRCNPLSQIDQNGEIITAVCKIIEESETTPTLKVLSEKTGYSESYIQRLFKKLTGISPKEYDFALKSHKFRSSIKDDNSITSSIYKAGFGSSSRAYENMDAILGMTAKEYKNQGKGIRIRLGIFSCYLGYVLIALSDKGVSSIEIGENEPDLQKQYYRRFSNAETIPLLASDKEIIEQILEKMEHPELILNIPLDMRGTFFQCKVWKALLAIPAGETKTYSRIASDIGQPNAVRAVANACGCNKIALLIPCHRVVRKNGELGGYKWGIERKKMILERELEI